MSYKKYSGTKCCGANSLCKDGTSLNDSHAEVMCRRGFLRYLYEEISKSIDQRSTSIFVLDTTKRKCILQEEFSFHFLTSHAPCGDASIFPTQNYEKVNYDAKRIKLNINNCMYHFTGAKIICSETEEIIDKMNQTIGPIRTKPGRGDPTLSVSCSDKLAKWCMVGIQGALLASLIEQPIYLESITFCNSLFSCVDALERALWGRFYSNSQFRCGKFHFTKPIIQKCNQIDFEFERNDKLTPSPTSIVWCKVLKKPHEIAVSGRCLGATKKNLCSSNSQLQISKRNLFIAYSQITKSLGLNSMEDNLTYEETKKASEEYYVTWNRAKKEFFKYWVTKPQNLNQFRLNDN